MHLNKIAHTILKRNYKKLKVKESALQEPETIHEMRVAIRRLRAALQLFKTILPKDANRIRKELAACRQILGRKRDFDLFLASTHLKKWTSKPEKDVLTLLRSKKYASLLASLKKLKTEKTQKDPLKFAKKEIQKALKRVFERASQKELHPLRIAIKKLRYICEFFASICPLDVLIEKTIQMQDSLGDYQDAVVGLTLLNRYKKRFSLQEYLEIQKRYEIKKKQALKAFLKIWKKDENTIKRIPC